MNDLRSLAADICRHVNQAWRTMYSNQDELNKGGDLSVVWETEATPRNPANAGTNQVLPCFRKDLVISAHTS